MFTFRRRKSSISQQEPPIRGSPSLPQLLTNEGIPWPKDLVDMSTMEQAAHAVHPQQGAAKTSLQRIDHAPIPFHKPFRASPGKSTEGMPISSLYMSNSPPVFENWKTNLPSATRYTGSQRRARAPPTFNLMVVGSQGTGKTSLLRLLLETADISPGANVDQRVAVDRFLRGSPKTTQSIQTACVEICESRFDRVLFSVIDTPGLDFLEGRELKLERQVSGIIKYVDAQYADTMAEESKVVRKSKGDQHIHLCIYMIDPASIMTQAAHRARSSLPTKTRSETTVSYRDPPELVPDTSSGDDSEDEDEGPMTMSPAEIRVIRRLSARCNVLPVIARSDSLTDDKLATIKQVVRTNLAEAGLDFGVFLVPKKARDHKEAEVETPKRQTHFANDADDGHVNGNGVADDGSDDEEERQSRPVIKLRPKRHANGRNLSRSRSRRDLSRAADDDRRPQSPDQTDRESVANVRFSAHIVAKTDLSSLLPFALIAPETTKRRHRVQSSDSQLLSTAPSSPQQMSEDGHPPSITDTIPQTPASAHSTKLAYLEGPPDDLKGVFTRKFRWGTVDVLEPSHCDFPALRTAVLSTHLKVLKTHTKEVLYEKYRTEKLLARRATRHITDEERHRLLEGESLDNSAKAQSPKLPQRVQI